MAGEFEICLPIQAAGETTAAAFAALDLIQRLDRQLSFFREGSEISRINRTAADRPVEVEPWLFALLQLAMRICRESEGAYDITAAPLWEAWGFARRAGGVPSAERLATAQGLVGGQWIELDPEAQTIRFLRHGMRLNLGSIGKGYAVDRAVQHILAAGATDFLVHGGYSSAAGRGSPGATLPSQGQGGPIVTATKMGTGATTDCGSSKPTLQDVVEPGPQTDTPWKIGVKDPLYEDRRVGQILLRDRALGTSGAQFQSFRHQGRRYGHILDPRTGWPAAGVLSVTVLAPTAAEADALSTAFYVMGPDAAEAYCRSHPAVAMIMFCPSEGNRWELRHSGLREESAELLAAVESR
jgi:thiamine biosynthesis lipoprotein